MSFQLPADPDSAALAERLRALAHPARLQVLETLARREGCLCGEIVAGLPLAQSTVSQHIKILLEAGLVTGRLDGARSCYCLDRAAVACLRAHMNALFDRLEREPVESRTTPQRAADLPSKTAMQGQDNT